MVFQTSHRFKYNSTRNPKAIKHSTNGEDWLFFFDGTFWGLQGYLAVAGR
jgi:hypothetical protein